MQTQAPQRVRRSFNDKIDDRILHVLQKDGRISNLQLAEQVHLSPSAVFERVKRLQREGYILGYQARLSHEKLGMEVIAFVEVQLERMNPEVMQRFEQAVRERPAILECYLIAGTFDYLLKVVVSDMHACRELVASEISKLPGVREARTHAGVEQGDAGACAGAEPPIDGVDAHLLRLLQADGRCSIARLAEELDITAAVARERLARLSRKGYILGYFAILNEAKLKSGLQVFAAIRTTAAATGVARTLAAAVLEHDEIVECHDVTGNFDHLLKLRVPDMRRHNELMEALVWRLAGVREVRTYAVIDEVKNTTRIPL
jgi:Lrp/AsnC family transcriptional regulator, leucine-responsive regulatory protein